MLKSRKPVPKHKRAQQRSLRYDPFVYTSKSIYMQRLMDAVSHGHQPYATGESMEENIWRLVQKFATVYQVHLDRNARARLRAEGEGTAVMLLWRSAPGLFRWYLLVSRTGEHPARKLEKLHDPLQPQTRITLTGYELVRLPKSPSKGQQRESSVTKRAKKQSDGLTWTWRMTANNYEAWRLRAITTARSDNAFEVKQMLDVLYATPGFRGCRHQVGKIVALFHAEWRRARSDSEPFPPERPLYYHRRLPDAGMHLRALLKESRTAEREAAAAAEASVKAQAGLALETSAASAPPGAQSTLTLDALIAQAQADAGAQV